VITERLSAEGPISYRLNAIDVARQMISSNPILGRGYGNFGHLYEKYATDWTQKNVLPAPHNTYINILVSSGLVGFLPYISIFASIAYQGWILWRRGQHNHAIDRELLVCMVAALLVYAATIFFSDIVAIPYVTSLFFFITGFVLGSQERASRWGDPEVWLA
jgi:O-antigen ligase